MAYYVLKIVKTQLSTDITAFESDQSTQFNVSLDCDTVQNTKRN